jgi:hypothetical protein
MAEKMDKNNENEMNKKIDMKVERITKMAANTQLSTLESTVTNDEGVTLVEGKPESGRDEAKGPEVESSPTTEGSGLSLELCLPKEWMDWDLLDKHDKQFKIDGIILPEEEYQVVRNRKGKSKDKSMNIAEGMPDTMNKFDVLKQEETKTEIVNVNEAETAVRNDVNVLNVHEKRQSGRVDSIKGRKQRGKRRNVSELEVKRKVREINGVLAKRSKIVNTIGIHQINIDECLADLNELLIANYEEKGDKAIFDKLMAMMSDAKFEHEMMVRKIKDRQSEKIDLEHARQIRDELMLKYTEYKHQQSGEKQWEKYKIEHKESVATTPEDRKKIELVKH